MHIYSYLQSYIRTYVHIHIIYIHIYILIYKQIHTYVHTIYTYTWPAPAHVSTSVPCYSIITNFVHLLHKIKLDGLVLNFASAHGTRGFNTKKHMLLWGPGQIKLIERLDYQPGGSKIQDSWELVFGG